MQGSNCITILTGISLASESSILQNHYFFGTRENGTCWVTNVALSKRARGQTNSIDLEEKINKREINQLWTRFRPNARDRFFILCKEWLNYCILLSSCARLLRVHSHFCIILYFILVAKVHANRRPTDSPIHNQPPSPQCFKKKFLPKICGRFTPPIHL